jgi:hypothetical protein
MTKTVATKSELNSISKQIYYTFIVGGNTLPGMSDESWQEYIRKNMESSAENRDCAKDLWDTYYRVRETDAVSAGECSGFKVLSAGPDTEYATGDDLVAEYCY